MKRLFIPLTVLALLLAACGTDTSSTTSSTSTSSDNKNAMGAAFAITEVDFVDATFTITNVGDEAGNLDGYTVCQRPNYSTIADVSLEPGESIAIDASEVGGFVPENGEVALYTDRSFDDSQAIVSYVEWGSPGHGRSSVAIDAGIWQEDAAVSTTGDTKLMTTNGEVATTPAEWEVG